jgi:hypothetical protein
MTLLIKSTPTCDRPLVKDMVKPHWNPAPCSFGLSATSQQYFSLRINQPSTTSQQYFSLRTNQHQPPANSQTNRLQMSLNVRRNFCRVLQISPKQFKISQYESCLVFRGTQLSCWKAFQIFSGKGWKTWSTASSSCSPKQSGIQNLAAICAKCVEKNTLKPL